MFQQNPYGQSHAMNSNTGMTHPPEIKADQGMNQYSNQQQVQVQQQYVNQQGSSMNSRTSPVESNAAIKLMGVPNSIGVVWNTSTGQNDYFQTQLIEVSLNRNQHGFGINLGDENGVVRIQGCRPNPDGTPSPGQLNNLIRPRDVIYKVQNIVIEGPDPLNKVCSVCTSSTSSLGC